MKRNIISVLLVLMLVLSFSLVTAVPVSAATLTSVSATTDNSTAGATANYTLAFTTATSGNITTIDMVFATGFDVSGAQLGTVTGIGAGSISVSGDNVTYTVTSPEVVADNVSISIGLSQVVNPTASGSHNITITTRDDLGAEIDSETTSVTIDPGPIAHFSLVTEHGGIEVAGTAFSVNVTAQDQYNNTATSYNGTAVSITFTSTAMAAPSGTSPTIPSPQTLNFSTTPGVATATGFILVNTGESPTITASDGTYTGTSAAINVNPAAVASLTVTVQPSNAVYGVAITPPVKVSAVDQYSNNVTGQNITASLQVGTGVLSGNVTRVTDAQGIATFDDLSINLGGAKVLRFTADSVTVDSDSFTIYPALNSNTETWYLTIQSAIGAATAGDTIVVSPGTYSGNITIDRAVALVSAAGSANTTIDASGLGTDAVIITSANVTLGRLDAGFTITGANTTGKSGIQLNGSNCRIDSNNINNNYNGIKIEGSENHVRRNTITGNSNYGIYFVSDAIGEGWNEVHYNNITGNTEYGAYADPKTGEPYWMQWAGFNYWGDLSSGPGGAGPGIGDKVNQHVWYNPWLNDSYSTILASGIADISTAIPVKVGWNTLSTPLALSGNVTDPSLLWKDIVSRSGLTNFTACTYDATNKTFVNLGTDSTMPLDPLDAVFIKVSADQKVSFRVSTSINSPPTSQLQSGWNLIGAAMSITERELEMWKVLVSVDKTADGLIGYDMVVSPPLATQPPWVYVRGQEEATGFEWKKMDFGRGYWIYMENADEFAGFSSTPITARVWD